MKIAEAASGLLPRGPVLEWPRLSRQAGERMPAIDDIQNQLLTTSGRAALYLALKALALPAGSKVLVPTYHCPTMIAPVVLAGLRPYFYAIGEDALPKLAALADEALQGTHAIIVAHLFGLPRPLDGVRRWCDERQIALIEDCAHCFFGQSGDRNVGQWGDFATASLTKFYAVPEAGLLVSARRRLPTETLAAQSTVAQIKGMVDVLEHAERAHRLAGLRPLLTGLFALKRRKKDAGLMRTSAVATGPVAPPNAPADELQGCDMTRAESAPLAISSLLFRHAARSTIASQRRRNFQRMAQALKEARGARVLFAEGACDAPYALPLWVDDADRVYAALRAQQMPVFRWDRTWPGTPELPDDQGTLWSHHVLQLLCHQSLHDADIDRVCQATLHLLSAPVVAGRAAAALDAT